MLKKNLSSFFYATLLLILLSFGSTVHAHFKHKKVAIADAGDNQVVNAGDTVQLSGAVTFGKGGKKCKRIRGKFRRKICKILYRYKKHRHYHKHRGRFSSGRKSARIVINWEQTGGSIVDLVDSDGLNPYFIAPALTGDEILTFSLVVSNEDGKILDSDSVDITIEAPVLPLSTISGRITAVDGSEVGHATINILTSGSSETVSADVDGLFAIELNASSDAVLQLSADGYADQVVPVKAPDTDGNIFLTITMIQRGATQAFDSGEDTTLTGGDGASVSVSADSFIDANGAPVSGDIDLTITPVDVSRYSSLAAFPGEFAGIPEGESSESLIISFGTVEFEFTQNSEPIQLAPGQSADIIIPIYFETYQDGSLVSVGDTIPLWSLDEGTGIWSQEGVGIVIASTESPTGFAMEASVNHFSWWNCDVSANTAQIIVTVWGPDSGTALIKAHTLADIGWRPDTVDTVSNVGQPTLPLRIPANSEVCLWAQVSFDDGGSGTTTQTCLIAVPDSVINVDLNSPTDESVNIITRPAAVADVLDVTAFPGYSIRRIQLQPSTWETAVSYTIVSGALPAGISLNQVSSISAELAGVTTEIGLFSVVIEASDAEGNTDSVTINISVTSEVTVPDLEPYFGISYDPQSLPYTYDLNIHNLGGPVTNWVLSQNDEEVQVDFTPSAISLNPVTGILTITDWCIFWSGIVTGSNDAGSSQAFIEVWDPFCS